ncbi:metallophosphoesterase family protein [Megalodesulfovibrio gigas]|uniref:Putative metallophosphoesterase n=1 Tax=Megalodesulfovibrio gigas (strain ATCC 19364 / DSM 1382 / NCIMB 9332 / VKM B-1759) TaxID=1121448 RepID=T2G902_MEGG1|nr:metallophosphoesterase family protein [Megalodesulfovibrio gigas]AGW12591.1 putative metallophosphoesterase [Megalodesulfovibrio gigas DSM 1382 = ATCC 19364]
MRLAVLADIHGNLEALQAVWEDVQRREVDAVYCLGDMVGYGPDPLAVLEFLEAHGVRMVQGNHEWALMGVGRSIWFNFLAQMALQRTRVLLGRPAMRRLQALPYARVAHDCRFVHGFPPESCMKYLFKAGRAELQVMFRHLRQRICFVGHTHLLGWMEWADGRVLRHSLREGEHPVDPATRHVINVGSVGQPREHDKRAKYVIWDAARHRLEVMALTYDAQTTAAKIIARGIPKAYATKLL